MKRRNFLKGLLASPLVFIKGKKAEALPFKPNKAQQTILTKARQMGMNPMIMCNAETTTISRWFYSSYIDEKGQYESIGIA